jgi:ABC-2 type transport system ATP-binding protein
MTEENKKVMVEVNHVAKFFKLPVESTDSLKRTFINRIKGVKGYREQHVLKDLDFKVYEGDFIGIVGRNGAGKSTLLKILSEIYAPNKGSVKVNGKLVPFIELGVGFNPELTGRENVYLNGAMFGFSNSEVEEMYDDIVSFAELHDFMEQKLKNYSSGMQVRLAFSIAVKAQADVLLLDEVLAVGDESFQRKCATHFKQLREEGKTVILVTHDMGAVRKYCNRAILIEYGEIKIQGTPEDVASQYSLDNFGSGEVQANVDGKENGGKKGEAAKNEFIENISVELITPNVINDDRTVEFEIKYDVIKDIQTCIAFSMTDADRGFWMYNDNSLDQPTSGIGTFTSRYKCNLDNINQCKLKLEASVRNDNFDIIGMIPDSYAPIIIIEPKKDLDQRNQKSSSGCLKRTGDFEITKG